MTARTTGPGRASGSGGTPRRPTKRPAAGRPAGAKTAKDNPAGLTVVDGTTALKAVDDEVEEDARVEAAEAAEAPEAVAAEVEAAEAGAAEAPRAEDAGTEEPAEARADVEAPDAEEDVVIDLTALEEMPQDAEEAPAATSPSTDPAGIPPIDANVLLRAILTPPAGIANGEGLTDALTGAVPTWRLDEEPIYLETIRDLGVPAVPEADGGTGEVIVGEIVQQEA